MLKKNMKLRRALLRSSCNLSKYAVPNPDIDGAFQEAVEGPRQCLNNHYAFRPGTLRENRLPT